MTSADEYARFARAHLPEPFAGKWISLLRPAVQFPQSAAPGETPALCLGGNPSLPDEVEWPRFEGYGPLSFIADLDCAAIAAVGGVDLLPESGHLLFFCVDDRYEGRLTRTSGLRVASDRLDRRAGALRARKHTATAPAGTSVARTVRDGPATSAGGEHSTRTLAGSLSNGTSALRRKFSSIHCTRCGPKSSRLGSTPCRETYSHCGGHSRPCQDPLERKAAAAAIDAGRSAHINVLDEAEHWRVLLQIPEADDLGMNWGDVPVAYWMIRDDDLTARRFDRIWFTMQN